MPVISVFLAPKAPLSADVVVRGSAREQVLDTVIEYGDTLVLVVENKVAEAGWDQALNLNVEGAGAQRAERPALVRGQIQIAQPTARLRRRHGRRSAVRSLRRQAVMRRQPPRRRVPVVSDFAVVDNPDEHRYEVLVDGEFAGASYYRDQNGVRIVSHTEVEREFEGTVWEVGSSRAKRRSGPARPRALP